MHVATVLHVHILTKFSANLRKLDYHAASMNCTQTQLRANTIILWSIFTHPKAVDSLYLKINCGISLIIG